MKVNKDLLLGVVTLGLVPLICLLGAIFLPYLISLLEIPMSSYQVWFILALFFFLYLYALSQPVAYDYRKIRKITIRAPKQIQDLLKGTTERGFLINVELISAFKNDYVLSQTDLVNYVKERGIELTGKRIRDYITKLEKENIIHSPSTAAWKKEYNLTEKGKWCYKCVEKCFPKRYFWFVYRNYLGRNKLPSFPSSD